MGLSYKIVIRQSRAFMRPVRNALMTLARDRKSWEKSITIKNGTHFHFRLEWGLAQR